VAFVIDGLEVPEIIQRLGTKMHDHHRFFLLVSVTNTKKLHNDASIRGVVLSLRDFKKKITRMGNKNKKVISLVGENDPREVVIDGASFSVKFPSGKIISYGKTNPGWARKDVHAIIKRTIKEGRSGSMEWMEIEWLEEVEPDPSGEEAVYKAVAAVAAPLTSCITPNPSSRCCAVPPKRSR